MSKKKLKKWLIIIIIFVILIVTVAFIVKLNDSNRPVEPQTTTEQQTTTDPQISTEPQPTENNENIIEESATPLTEDELKEFYMNAHKLYAEWLSPDNNLIVDWDNITEIDGIEYFAVNSTEITSVEELKTELKKYFDNEIITETVDKYYVMYDGKMYGNAVLVEGGDIPWESHKMTVNTNTNTECVITITSYIGDDKQDLEYRLKVIDGEWKFTDVFQWVSMQELVLE